MGRNGFIKLHRKMLDWGWYQDNNTKAVFLHLLLTANWEESDFLGQQVERGQVVYGRKQLAKDLNLSERSVRTALSHLVTSGEMTIKTTKRFSIGTIVNYGKYQDAATQSDQQTDCQETGNRPDSDQIQTTSKKIRNKEVYHQPRQAAWSGSRYSRDQEYVAEWDVPLWTSKGKVTNEQ